MDAQTSTNASPPSQEWGFVDSTNRPINLLEAFSRATDVHADYYQDRATSATDDSVTGPIVVNGLIGDTPSNEHLGAYSLTSQILRHLKYIDGDADEIGVQMSLEPGMDYPRSEETPASTEQPAGSSSHPGTVSMQPYTPRSDHGAKEFSRVYKYQADLRLTTPEGPRTGSGLRLRQTRDATPSVNGHRVAHDVDGAIVTGHPLLAVEPTTLDTAEASILDGDTLSWEIMGTRDWVWGATISCNGERVEGYVFHELSLDITLRGV